MSAWMLTIAAVLAQLLSIGIFWHVVQANGPFEERSCCSMVALGTQQEVNRVTSPVNRPVKVLPLAGDIDVRFVHAPVFANRLLASAADRGQYK